MIATVHQLHQRAVCSSCGTRATCECNAPYVPARVYAAAAIAKNPTKSNRAIAAECGLNHMTVGRARKSGGTFVPPNSKRTGLDGKKQAASKNPKAPQPPPVILAPRMSDPIQEDCTECGNDMQQRWEFSAASFAGDALKMNAFWNREFGNWKKFKVTPSLVKLATQAAAAWVDMAKTLKSLEDK